MRGPFASGKDAIIVGGNKNCGTHRHYKRKVPTYAQSFGRSWRGSAHRDYYLCPFENDRGKFEPQFDFSKESFQRFYLQVK